MAAPHNEADWAAWRAQASIRAAIALLETYAHRYDWTYRVDGLYRLRSALRRIEQEHGLPPPGWRADVREE